MRIKLINEQTGFDVELEYGGDILITEPGLAGYRSKWNALSIATQRELGEIIFKAMDMIYDTRSALLRDDSDDE